MFKSTLYKLETLTNLHVGGSSISYSLIDKEVQREAITNLPQINSSSLKGALREYTKHNIVNNSGNEDAGDGTIRVIFGQKPLETDTQNAKPKNKEGYMIFNDARLLALPIRCNKTPYILATSNELLNEYIEYCKIFNCQIPIEKFELEEGYYNGGNLDEIITENEDWKLIYQNNNDNLIEIFGDTPIVVLSDEKFRDHANNLPIIARNVLDNGISKNLWYEEIVPRKSIFYVALQEPKKNLIAYKRANDAKIQDADIEEYFKNFHNMLNNAKILLGSSKSVGYGKVLFTKMEDQNV